MRSNLTKIKLTEEEVSLVKALAGKLIPNGVSSSGTSATRKAFQNANFEDNSKNVFIEARRAMKKFMALPKEAQNSKMKKACIDAILSTSKHYRDSKRFWTDLEVEASRLNRASDLLTFCEENHLNLTAVKQHLILEGKKTVNDIILNGIGRYEGRIRLFGDLLYGEEIPGSPNAKEAAHE